jgi:hypothetical protein
VGYNISPLKRVELKMLTTKTADDISLNNYPRILFSLDMALVYHTAHRRNHVKKTGTEIFSRENMLIVLFF